MWKHERLVIDKWFALQMTHGAPEDSVINLNKLLQNPDFNIKNPNRFRSLIATFASTPAAFHQPGGAGYDIFSDQLIALDVLNPQLTARMCSAFETWKRYDADRQAMMSAAMTRIVNRPGASRDVCEMLNRLLGA